MIPVILYILAIIAAVLIAPTAEVFLLMVLIIWAISGLIMIVDVIFFW